MLQDDGRLLAESMRRVKRVEPSAIPFVAPGLDQTMHVLALVRLAIVV